MIVATDGSKPTVSLLELLYKVFSYGRVNIRIRLRDRLPLVVEVLRFLLMSPHKLLSVQKIKIQRTFQVALVIETVVSVSITGKFETEAQILAKRLAKRSYWRPLLQFQKTVEFSFL